MLFTLSPILFSPLINKLTFRRLIKPLGSGLLTLIFTAPQVIFGGNLVSSNQVLAQTPNTNCPTGTNPILLDWNPTTDLEGILNQTLSAGGITATIQFTESVPGQVIDPEETRITSESEGLYGGQPPPNLRFNIGRRQSPGGPDLPAPPDSNGTLIINFSQPIQVAPLLLLDIDRDGARDRGFPFQDKVRVTASNNNTTVGVSLRALGPDVEIVNNVATGVRENAESDSTDGNVEATVNGPVTQIQIEYTAGTDFAIPRQDETIGLARLNLCTGPGSIGDTVFNDRNGDGVQNQGEPGIPDVTLTLTLPGPDNQLGTADDTRSTTTTNENGIYGFNNLPTGPYQVTLTPPANFSEITTGNPQRTVNLQVAQNLDNVDFGLRAGPVAPEGETNLRLVKRITGAFRSNGQAFGENFNTFVNDPNDNNDDAFNQQRPNTVLGVSQLQTPVQSGDEVEYTIYFLGEGGEPLQNVRICDFVPPQTSFSADAFGSGRGIRLQQANTDITLSNTEDGDQGAFYSPLTPLADRSGGDACQNQNNPNGAIIVNIGNVPPDNNFGLVRFRVKID